MNIRSARLYDSLMAANEKPFMADRTVQPASAGATDTTSNAQAKLDTYTPSDRHSAEAAETSPVYTRALFKRNAQALASEASPSDTALLTSQKTRVNQDDTKAVLNDVATGKDNTAPAEPDNTVKEQDKISASEPVKPAATALPADGP
ncbi:type III effector, partial [Pseudomonas syringae]